MNQPKRPRRTKAAKPKQPRTHFSLALPPEEVAGLKTILAWMLSDPEHADARPCYQTTVRYALAHTLAHPPAHVRASGQ